MRDRFLVVVLALGVWLPAVAFAQTAAAVSGTVADESKAVLPGVTVTAMELSTGRQYMSGTDERGVYRLANVQPGTYKVQAELPGFATAIVSNVELLVGQNATINFSLKLSGIQENLTVTAEAPLIDITSARVSGNVDRRQMEELPLQGRNWMELSMLVKGVTSNAVGETPGVSRDQQFQLNLDGQQITQKIASAGSFGEPRLSREAIAEFQVITNMFDISQGRSNGIQVQAISRSGSNDLHGSFYGYFRNDKLNGADFLAKRVLPYENQQVGFAVGGPVVRNKLQYFGVYEYEREPNTFFLEPPALPGQRFTLPTKNQHHNMLVRADSQLSKRDNLMVRGQYWRWENPFDAPGAVTNWHPSQATHRNRDTTNIIGTWSRVIRDTMVQQIKVGFSHYHWRNEMADLKNFGNLVPSYVFPGITVGGRENFTQEFFNRTPSVSYDLSGHRGNHQFKVGGEYLAWYDDGVFFKKRRGEYFFSALPPDLGRRIPADAYNDPTRWDFSGLDPLVIRFEQWFAKDWSLDIPRPNFAAWFGDTWRVRNNLTLNLGVRWDDDLGVTAPPHVKETDVLIDNGFEKINVGYKNGIRDHNNVAPRVGFTYNVAGSNDLVIRGGTGLFYTSQVSNITFAHQMFNGQRVLTVAFQNDGKPGFVQDPRRGLTGEDILAGRVTVPPQGPQVISPAFRMPYTWQSMLGFQKQLNQVMAFDADLVYWRGYSEARGRDPNLFYNPVTGYNKDPRTSGRPNPSIDAVEWRETTGKADYMALATSFTRRFRNNWQGGLTYTLMFFQRDTNNAGFGQLVTNNPFNLDAEWARTIDYQQHTLRANGIYRLPWGLSLAGAYFFGSGSYYSTFIAAIPFGSPGVNRLNIGSPLRIPASAADRFDGPAVIETGAVAPRNALKGKPLHKMDVRVTKEVSLRGVKLAGIAEVFNLFNHANYGNYNVQLNSATFGDPRQNTNSAYLPRIVQLAFRVTY